MISHHRADHTQIIDHIAHVGKQITDHDSRLTTRLKSPFRLTKVAFKIAGFPLLIIHRNRFAIIGEEPWLVIERLHMGDTTRHVKEDDAFRLRLESRLPWCERIHKSLRAFGLREFAQNDIQRYCAKATTGTLQKLTTIGGDHVSRFNRQIGIRFSRTRSVCRQPGLPWHEHPEPPRSRPGFRCKPEERSIQHRSPPT